MMYVFDTAHAKPTCLTVFIIAFLGATFPLLIFKCHNNKKKNLFCITCVEASVVLGAVFSIAQFMYYPIYHPSGVSIAECA